jgi:ketosteroid isomerase-like protein
MKQKFTTATLILAICFTGIAQTTKKASGKHNVEQELMQMEHDWSAAFLNHDVSAVARILADDYVGTDGRGIMTTKAEEMEEAKAPAPGAPMPERAILEETISDLKVRVYGNTAVVTGIANEKVSFKGKESLIRYRRTTVYVKRQGRWQCVSFHGSRMIEPPK